MKNTFKKFSAVALAAVMVIGSGAVAFAAETTGSLAGTGSTTGHLDKKVLSVKLPVVAANDNTFDYIIDPEGHIAATGYALGGDEVSGNDAGVYFQVSGGDYASASDTLEAVNESSVDIELTVKAEVTANDKNIALAESKDALKDATDPALYLGLKVGDEAAEVIKSTGATKTVTIEGVEDNFEEVYDKVKDEYAYSLKDDPAEWESTTIGLEGAVKSGEIADDVVAPKVTITWSWAEKTDAYVSAKTVSATSKSVTLSMPDGVSVAGVVLALNGSDVQLTKGNQYTVSGTTLSFVKLASSWSGGTLKVTYSDNHVDEIAVQ